MSDQTSPLHDQSALDAPIPARSRFAIAWRPRIDARSLVSDRARLMAIAAMVVIVLAGGYVRFTHVNWDHAIGKDANSGHLHPDERFLTDITMNTRAPSGVGEFFDTDTSPLNPYNITRGDGSKQSTFVYGTLPVFTVKAVASNASLPYDALETVGLGDPVNATLGALTFGKVALPHNDYTTYDTYNLAGRWTSALIDVLTIVVVFMLGWRLANRHVGIMAAALYAFAPFAIQNAHFYIVDPYVTFFGALTLYFAVTGAKQGGFHNFALAGLAAGLATASKTTAVALLPVAVLGPVIWSAPAVVPYIAPIWAGDTTEYAARRDGRKLDRAVLLFAGGAFVTLVAAFIAYRLAMPYAFRAPALADLVTLQSGQLGPFPTLYPDIMNPHWLADIQNQERLLGGESFPPNVQWVARSRWEWPLLQMVVWGMGPALGITAWIGVWFAAIRAWRVRDAAWLIPLAWVLGYFAFMGAQFSLYMRYFLPLYPALTVFAAFVMYHAWRWALSPAPYGSLGGTRARLSALVPPTRVLVRAGVVTVLVFTVLAGVAFYNIYRAPVTRAEASCWIYQNVPENAVIGHEHWDDVVPYGQPDCPNVAYGSVTFNNFERDTPERVDQLVRDIDAVDYIALASDRLSLTVTRVPAVYPVVSRYYEALESGELGFTKVKEFSSHPRLFGREFDDTYAEESFSVYDHPRVTIYKKNDDFSIEKARDVLGAEAFIDACNAKPKDAGQNCLLYTPDTLAAQKAGGTWTDTFDPGSLFNRFPAFSFLLVLQIAAFAVLPFTIVLFRGLPDRGYLLAKPLGVLGLAYLVYAPASYGLIDFTRGSIAGILALMVLAGMAAAYRGRGEIGAWLRDNWRFALACEAVFLLAFLLSYWIRLQNPDLYHPYTGGEKPMDFTYFNGVLRTTDMTQGPVDPWYAGGYLNYYWWGFFIGATPVKLLGIVPEVAYNLVVPMFFALAAAATFSVAYGLTEGTRRLIRLRPGGVAISAAGPIVAAVAAVFFVMIAGNLKAVDVLATSFSKASPWHPDIPVVGDVVAVFGGLYKSLAPGFLGGDDGPDGSLSFTNLVQGYDWWAPSRALTIIPGQQNTVTPITEFPFWTYLFADLHAHLMAIPFAMTATGVALGAVMNFSRLNPVTDDGRRVSRELASWSMVVVLAVIVGALRWVNSWDYPPFMLVAAAGLILGERAKEGRWTVRAVSTGVLKSAVMAALTFVLFSVVAKNYSQSYNSINQADQTTDLTDYLSHFGVFTFIIGGFLVLQLARAITRSRGLRGIFFGGGRYTQPIHVLPVMLAILLAAALTIVLFTTSRWGVTGLAFVGLVTLIMLTVYEVRSHSPAAPVMLFVYAMIALGFGLSGGVELITLEGDVGRMNTVFKFYLHVWMMWGVVSAFALWYIFAVLRPHEAFLRRAGELNAAAVLVPRYAFAAVVALFIVAMLVYPYFGTRARVHERFDPSLGASNDGLAWMEAQNIREGGHDNFYVVEYDATGIKGEHELRHTRDAIDWVRHNVPGTPTIIEAIGPSYRSLGSRFAINTGLPTVHGWGFHQSQQRVKFAQTLQQRQADVNEFYTTQDVGRARDILNKYDVGWVIVGDEERFNYGDDGLVKFEDGLDGFLELAYENPSNQIWRVIPPAERADASARRQAER